LKRRVVLFVLMSVLLTFINVHDVRAINKNVGSMHEEAPRMNALAPSFTLKDYEGNSFAVGGSRRKLLFINFWASWCGPCRAEAPELKKIFEKYKNQIDLYAVNSTPYDNMKDAMAFVKEFNLAFPVLFDVKGEVTDKYRVQAFPTSYLIDENGVVRDIIIGLVSPQQLESKIVKLLK
jgi:thiol-disulfide isomerase/thioredoxin